MRVLIDMDGVVLNMLWAVKEALPDLQPHLVTDYDFKCECGAPREQIKKVLCMPETFERQCVYDSVGTAILLLQFYGIETWAYTEVPESCLDIRNRQIKALGLKGEAYLYGQKPVNIEGYDAVFEDCTATLDKWYSGMLTKYIIDRPYNKDCTCALRFPDLYSAACDFLERVRRR